VSLHHPVPVSLSDERLIVADSNRSTDAVHWQSPPTLTPLTNVRLKFTRQLSLCNVHSSFCGAARIISTIPAAYFETEAE
jgi:hypothetical protein